jgi:choline dehydrogenase-like flavoprotein
MQADPTLTLDLTSITEESRRLADSIKPRNGRWDVIIVGSGAAGGMAAFQLATAGIKVLLLEAGRMIDTPTEYRTMEWPYASMRRSRLPPGERAVAVAEYNFLDRPYGANSALAKDRKIMSYAGNTFTRNWVVDEREHPTTGTPYAGVRARILGGRTNFWGRGALRYGPLQFKAASLDGFDVDWPISYEDVKPYYDKVDVLLGCSGTKEGLEQVPDGIFQRPSKLNCVEVAFKRAIEDGPSVYSGPRRRHHRRRDEQVSFTLPRSRPLRARLRSPVILPLADRPHLSGARYRKPDGAALLRGVGGAR